ncbi:hypothetical protein VNO77_05689 [Canavalia gladiata]|uniref:Uncharacterized protein n=1 Tax=Canavalia gladiata TaxID=3824 RepID=A0AAN9RED6_CANGL
MVASRSYIYVCWDGCRFVEFIFVSFLHDCDVGAPIKFPMPIIFRMKCPSRPFSATIKMAVIRFAIELAMSNRIVHAGKCDRDVSSSSELYN